MIENTRLQHDIHYLEEKNGMLYDRSVLDMDDDTSEKSMRDLICFAIQAEQCIIHALVLVLKQRDAHVSHLETRQNKGLLGLYDERKIYRVFSENHDLLLEQLGVTFSVFSSLIREMFVSGIYQKAIQSPEVQSFIARVVTELRDSRGMSGGAGEYFHAKKEYIEVYDELGEISYEVEKQRLENKNILVRYRSNFPEVIDVQRYFLQRENLQLQMELLERDPELNVEQLLEKTQEKRQEAEGEILSMEMDAALADRKSWFLGYEEVVDAGLLEKEKEEGKRISREIAMLTHDDVIARHPQYHLLTKKQRQELRRCFSTAMEIKDKEVGFTPHQVGFQLRSSWELSSILDKVKRTLANAGLDMNMDFCPGGETLSEKRRWYEEQIQVLQAQIQDTKTILIGLVNDPEVQEQRKHLACPELLDEIKGRLKALADAYREESRALTDAIGAILHSEGA